MRTELADLIWQCNGLSLVWTFQKVHLTGEGYLLFQQDIFQMTNIISFLFCSSYALIHFRTDTIEKHPRESNRFRVNNLDVLTEIEKIKLSHVMTEWRNLNIPAVWVTGTSQSVPDLFIVSCRAHLPAFSCTHHRSDPQAVKVTRPCRLPSPKPISCYAALESTEASPFYWILVAFNRYHSAADVMKQRYPCLFFFIWKTQWRFKVVERLDT